MLRTSYSERVTVGRHAPVSGARWSEQVRGRVRVYEPAGLMHASVASAVFLALATFVRGRALGEVFAGNAGFELPGRGDTVRAPDVSFLGAERVPADGFGDGWMCEAPDLAVEILSRRQSAWEMHEKLDDYFEAGTRLVWVIDPSNRTIVVHESRSSARSLREGDVLDGGRVLPGFTMPVDDLFQRVSR